MRNIRKFFVAILIATISLASFEVISAVQRTAKVEAASKPTVALKANKKNTAVTVTISPLKRAQGYQIYMKSDGEMQFKKVKDLKKDGTTSRSVTVSGLSAGEYIFKVRAYASVFNKTVYSSYSEEKNISLVAPETPLEKYKKAKTGESISFGSYYQDRDIRSGKKAIEWIVLSNDGNELFVVSKYGLDMQPYNEDIVDVTWEDCTLRKWLNSDFYNTAFSADDKNLIKTTTLKNNDSSENGTGVGNDTNDKVFLLSTEDMINTGYGFSSDNDVCDIARRCTATEYAKANGARTYNENEPNAWKEYATADGEPTCWWWLRSHGDGGVNAAYVMEVGSVNIGGEIVGPGKSLVRPALKINLNP